MEFNGQSNETTLSSADTNTANDKIVVLNNDWLINKNCYSYYKPETIFLHKLNMPYEDVVKRFREKLVSKISDGEYVMKNKDAIDLDKMIGLACIAMNESENNNKRLRMRNEILETKCVNHDCVVEERDGLKSELNKVIVNLCLALGREVCNNSDDTEHLTKEYAALYAQQQNDYHYMQIENENLKRTLNKQLADIRVKTLNDYDEMLNYMDRFNEEVRIKDLKLSQAMDDMNSIKAENEEKNHIIQLLQEHIIEFSNEFDNKMNGVFHNDSQDNNELHEGKSLILEHINQLEEFNVFDTEKCRLSVLIDALVRIHSNREDHLETINRHVDDQNQQLTKSNDDLKEWQRHLEDENEKLYSKIENYKRVQKMLMDKESEHNNLKDDYSKMQYMYDELCNANAVSKTLITEYRQQLVEKEMRCADSDHLIKTLQCSLTKETKKLNRTNSIYNDEVKKCHKVENEAQRAIEEYTARINEKNIEIASIKEECSALKDRIDSSCAEIDGLKHNISTLEYALNEKNKTLQETLKKLNDKQLVYNDSTRTTTSTQCNGQLLFRNLSKFEQQMDVLLDDMNVCKKKLVNYESVLRNMQTAVQQQVKLRNYRANKRENNNNDAAEQKLLKNAIDEKEMILFEHRKEMECLKREYDMDIARLTGIHVLRDLFNVYTLRIYK